MPLKLGGIGVSIMAYGHQITKIVERNNSNEILEETVNKRVSPLENRLNADLMFYMGPITSPTDDLIKDFIESAAKKRSKLVFMLETQGGYIEVAKRIVEVTRHHYKAVEFIVPNYAMSAGTILVMSGNAIYMNYYSTLGPIDPQIERPSGKGLIPALGYLAQYERLIKKSEDGKLTTAEMAFLLNKFDPAELYRYEQERELSISLLKEWLVKWKFKNWKVTKTKKRKVTLKMKEETAERIARKLNETDKWHSHSCGISMIVLKKELKLIIEDFGKDVNLNNAIRNYYGLISDYAQRRSHDVVLHAYGKYKGVSLR